LEVTIDLQRLHTSGFYRLSSDQRHGLEDLLNGAAEALAAHIDDPERGDVGWRKQTEETHLSHAHGHIEAAQHCAAGASIYYLDDDGLAHWKHAAARIALAVAREKSK
jgi:hypothetical protein